MIDPETFKVVLALIKACKDAEEELGMVFDWAADIDINSSCEGRPKRRIEKTLDAAIRQGVEFMNQE